MRERADTLQSATADFAFRMWRHRARLGKPEGREDEFWHAAAEQELRNEDKSSRLRTPENL
jgi:hypothetical protein